MTALQATVLLAVLTAFGAPAAAQSQTAAPPQQQPAPAAPVFQMPSIKPPSRVTSMHHMQIQQAKKVIEDHSKETEEDAPKAGSAEKGGDTPAPTGSFTERTHLADGQFKAKETLVIWPHLKNMLANVDQDKVTIGLTDLKKNPGSVPPMGLFLAARSLYERGQLRESTLYYYAGRLRSKFDILRWPSPKDSSTRASRSAVSTLGAEISEKISAWAHADAERLRQILRDVQDWDAKTPYAYHPGYAFPARSQPENKWPELLSAARRDFAKESDDIVAALKTLGK